MNQRDLEEQIQNLVDGTIDKEEGASLLGQLKEDPKLLEVYCQYHELHAALHRMSFSQGTLAEELSRISSDSRSGRLRRNLRLTGLATAAVLVLAGVLLRLILVSDPPPTVTLRSSPDSYLEVSHTLEGEKAPAPGTLAAGSRAKLAQGTVELTFANGVRSIVQGPADLTLHHEGKLYLHVGKAWFHVPAKAAGFQALTPEMTVTDLGTEFGVISQPNAYDEVHVFEGKVKVEALRARKEHAELAGKQARMIDAIGRLKETKLRPEAFLSELPTEPPSIHFSFDSVIDGQVPVAGSHRDAAPINARLVSRHPASSLIPGVVGRAVSLDGKGDWIDTDWPGFSGATPRSVAFWLRIPPQAEQASYLPAIAGWGDPTLLNTKWKVTVAPGKNPEHSFARLSFGHQRFDGTTPLNDGNWHHVVVTYSGETNDRGLADVAMHVDGRPENVVYNPGTGAARTTPGEIDTWTDRSASQPLRLGMGVENRPGTFRGDLDELHIYQSVISAETIQRLFSPSRQMKN